MNPNDKVVIGQEAVCPDGLGRVADKNDYRIRVDTYIKNRGCWWAYGNVELVEIPYVNLKLRKQNGGF